MARWTVRIQFANPEGLSRKQIRQGTIGGSAMYTSSIENSEAVGQLSGDRICEADCEI